MYREFDIIKKLLMNKEQQAVFLLPSINFKLKLDNRDDYDDDDDNLFSDNLNFAFSNLNNLDLKRKENKILAENIVSSIV